LGTYFFLSPREERKERGRKKEKEEKGRGREE
jgi:hypothetical protein